MGLIPSDLYKHACLRPGQAHSQATAKVAQACGGRRTEWNEETSREGSYGSAEV
jgi:hypothetical protein